jgi:hypothetical protein|tara:strand:+ start:337 stop:471 length:135 start_codon:yes stop_codon:yes gene_type:complete
MDNFEKLEVYHSLNGWTSSLGNFSNGCDSLKISGYDLNVNLNRK